MEQTPNQTSDATSNFVAHNWTNDGKPAGGVAYGVGFNISWQNGPLGQGEDRLAPNGAFVETILEVVAQRIEYYNTLQFKCVENDDALYHISVALERLRARTARRTTEGTEGTWNGN